MSWQTQWGTVKATNAKAAALYYEVSNVGKTIESSKKRIIWRLKVEEGREFEISLTHSLASGKKVLRIDGIVKYTSQSLSFGDWDYVFNLAGGHCVHIIIKPSVDLNDMYDLIIDGMSFRRLPERLNPNRSRQQGNAVTSATATASRTNSRGGSSGSRNSSFTYNYSNPSSRNGSRENSFTPWECTRCTLLNEKPLAPICEACGHPKPDYISPEARQRAKTLAASSLPPPPASRPTAKSETPQPNAFDVMWQNEPVAVASAPPTFNPFGDSESFPAPSVAAPRAVKPQDITSMLSGLDFTPAPVEETSPPMEATLQPASPDPTEDSSEQTSSGDLWASDMVNLNLKPEEQTRLQRSAKSYQTLEQARQRAPKEKVQVLPTPPVPVGYPTFNAAQMPPAPGFYGGMAPPQTMMYNTVGNANVGGYNMTPGFGNSQPNAMVPYGIYGMQQQASPFMTNAPQSMNGPQRQASTGMLGSDPFATLS
ncbi:hypothetical protein BBJ28_00022571 [Nothophytophthora sp. Chile5]|nr:hypothetical protein BBJ28_00022571 [Nothophytophthora sp. Chile5]